MCPYPKTIFSCNHIKLGENPIRICDAQREYVSKLVSEPCGERASHPLSTVRQPFECVACREKRTRFDGKIREAKTIIAEAKSKLQESYGKVIDEPKAAKVGTAEKGEEEEEEEAVSPKSGGPADAKAVFPEPDLLDPAEFLRRRMSDKYAHLMMS
ncbi:hypothetical protein MGN70_014211 [Eutypa lata]|uniref:Uncharacterized protein n=1 Tax=Eutypa lata (strain UCR-EL1) TaxID=1287681 RepID=M7TI80_EUTLA|nr:hypothetical protein UCREL1_3337 [Eutypa lata UCREL1]KAI1244340.1 hypothetical protein MGN70_014211 [Eutypa lata]